MTRSARSALVVHTMLLVLLVVLAVCDRRSEPLDVARLSTGPDEHADPALLHRIDASDLIAKFECNRCHEVPGIAPAPRDKHCFGCHQQIHDGTLDAKPDAISRWQGRIKSLRYAPSLTAADRLRRGWVKEFLLHPHDVRPGSIAEMPRLPLTDDEADRLATFLVPDDASAHRSDSIATSLVNPPANGSPSRGEELFRTLACGRCHRMTGATVDDAALHEAGSRQTGALHAAWVLAPDLRHARERVQPAQLARWIAAPRGAMPNLDVGEADARALAAFLTNAELAPLPERPTLERLAVLTREVTWTEVSQKVFHDQCWHCHAVPDFARGDGGPGNSGGFGFRPRGLDVSSYAGISQGSLDDGGERRSIFAPLADGTPRVVAHLMARYIEEAGGVVEGVQGMPLGLPALSLEQIQLVESWVVQGRPQ